MPLFCAISFSSSIDRFIMLILMRKKNNYICLFLVVMLFTSLLSLNKNKNNDNSNNHNNNCNICDNNNITIVIIIIIISCHAWQFGDPPAPFIYNSTKEI